MSRFAEFWATYPAGPRKVNKRGCEQKWKARKLDAIADVIIHGLHKWIHSKEWAERNGAFIPLPATWLNQDRWEAADMTTPAPAKLAVQATLDLLADMDRQAVAAANVSQASIDRAKQARQRVLESRLR